MPLVRSGVRLPFPSENSSKTDRYSWRGLTFIDRIAKMICRECHAGWHWDYSRAPDFYRLAITDGRNTLEYEIAAETLFNHDDEEFREFCLEILGDCRRVFKSPA